MPCTLVAPYELTSGSKLEYLGKFGARNQRFLPLRLMVAALMGSLPNNVFGISYPSVISLSLYTVASYTFHSVAVLMPKVAPVVGFGEKYKSLVVMRVWL